MINYFYRHTVISATELTHFATQSVASVSLLALGLLQTLGSLLLARTAAEGSLFLVFQILFALPLLFGSAEGSYREELLTSRLLFLIF